MRRSRRNPLTAGGDVSILRKPDMNAFSDRIRPNVIPRVIFSGAALILVSGCDNRQTDTRATAPAATSAGTEIDDGIVTAKVKSALLADPDVKSFDIAVVTRKGEAQLSGFVDNQTQIDHATELARAVDGVKSVANEMSAKK